MREYPKSLCADTLSNFLKTHAFSIIHLDGKWNAMGFMFNDRIKEISKNYLSSVGFGFIDVDDNQDLAMLLEVRNVPCCAYYSGSKRLISIIGLNQDLENNLRVLISGDTPGENTRIDLE